ncbi:TPA: 50S ribosomal protein L29 [Candidatus Bathyarchaeota archaeon]|nr:50S ribosomal protein L29 [Candidatus Bathyarchaeota archaeon]
MPALSADEVRRMGKEERAKKIEELRAELMKLRTDMKTKGKVENPSALRDLKRSIARLLTVQKEEELQGG